MSIEIKPKTFTIKLCNNLPFPYRRWEIIKFSSNGSTSVVTERGGKSGERISLLPYRVPQNKWFAKLKFFWLKIRVHYS
jgi:hypothetical protein